MQRPVRIGVTGGIGSGKSTLVKALADHGGVEVFSADSAVHRLYERDTDLRDAVVRRWGERVLTADGSIARGAIANIVFRDEAERRWLEGVIHPLVAREWLRFVHETEANYDDMLGDDARHMVGPVIVAEVPLLFEADLDDRYDFTVLVTAPLAARQQRVAVRDRGSMDALERAGAQLPDDAKAARADMVIVNDGTHADLVARAHEVLMRATGAA